MQTISFLNLSFMLIPLLVVGYFYAKWAGSKDEILIATIRMTVQLIAIGYVLVYLFENKDPFLGFGIVSFMMVVSAWIALRNTTDRTFEHYKTIFISIALSGLIQLFLIMVFVLDLQELYEPRFLIPIAGMIFANAMNVLSLAIERFEKEQQKGAAFIEAREFAFKASLIPQINSFLAVGLVSLPGMMTGQILSGVDPMIAVRYQIMIMVMVLSSAGIAMVFYFLMKEKTSKSDDIIQNNK